MHRLRYRWQEQNSEFNFTSTVWYQHAWIAILLTIRKVKLQLYEHNLISTCLDRDSVDRQKSETSTLRGYLDIDMHRLRYCWPLQNAECKFMWVVGYQYALIAILSSVRKVILQLYEDISISTCTDCDTADRCKIRNACLWGWFDIDMPRLRYRWPSEKSKSNFM